MKHMIDDHDPHSCDRFRCTFVLEVPCGSWLIREPGHWTWTLSFIHPWAKQLLFAVPTWRASNVIPNSTCMKNFKALRGCSLWIGKKLSNQRDIAKIVRYSIFCTFLWSIQYWADEPVCLIYWSALHILRFLSFSSLLLSFTQFYCLLFPS